MSYDAFVLPQACKGCDKPPFICDCEGIKGQPGVQGMHGVPGIEGPPGEMGADGPLGVLGEKGEFGEYGPIGDKGYRVSLESAADGDV